MQSLDKPKMIKAWLRSSLESGAIQLGLGGALMWSGLSRGNAEAAGIETSTSAARTVARRVELAAWGADPKAPRETITPSTVKPAAAADAASWDFKSRSPNVLKIEQTLKEPTEVNFTDIPLKDALNYLEELHHIAIWIDNKTLNEEGISTDTTVTLTMSGISLRSSLRLLLSPLLLDYVIRNDVLIITTSTVADEIFENRVYNTSRLPNISPKELVEIITKIVEPDRWKISKPAEAAPVAKAIAPVGGVSGSAIAETPATPNPAGVEGGGSDSSFGSASAVANTLVIRQTRRVHEEIVELLEQLERQQTSLPAKPVKP